MFNIYRVKITTIVYMNIEWLFLLILPIVAFFYAAVGHGGASGYLALMALFSFAPEQMKPTALLLNLFVAAISFFHYWRAGYFNWKLFLVFSVSSIPLSYFGGTMNIDPKIYKIILGILLIFAILKMLNVFGKEALIVKKVNLPFALIIGGAIGFFSGLIGIGGGIILSPVILLLNWGKVKDAAAVSALFIWVNSAAGMAGQLEKGIELSNESWVFVSIAVIGGFFGGYLGSVKMNNTAVRYLLAFVLLLASIKLFIV